MADNTLLIEDVVGRKAFDQLEALELNLDAINAQVLALVKTFDGLGRAVESASDLRALASAQQQLNKAQAQAVTVSRQQAAAQEAVSKAVKDSTDREAALQSALTKTAKSIKEARDQNKLLTAARNATNVSTREGVEALNRLNAKIDQNNAFIKANGDQALRQKLNIGNYASALDGLGGKFGGAARRVKGFADALKTIALKPLTLAFGGLTAAIGAAVGAFRLWARTTADGEEAARKFRLQFDLVKENLKNNAGFRMANRDLYDFKQGVQDVTEEESRAVLLASALGGTVASGMAKADMASRKASASAIQTGDAMAAVAVNFQKLLKEDEGLAKRREKYKNDMVAYERRQITVSGELAALQRDIAVYLERARDNSLSVEERERARLAAQEKINEAERIDVAQKKEKVRLTQENTELTNTERFKALQSIDTVTEAYRKEKEELEAVVSGYGDAEAIRSRTADTEARLLEERKKLAALPVPDLSVDYETLTDEERKALDIVRARYREQEQVVRGLESELATLGKSGDKWERLTYVEGELVKLSERRQSIARGTTGELEAQVQADNELAEAEASYANQRRSLSRLGRALTNEELAERKASLKDYTDTLKKELANRVAAAKASADEAKAVYNEKGNEGLNQLDDVEAWIQARHEALDAEQAAEEELTQKTAEKTIEILGLTGEEAAKVTEKMEADLLSIQEKYGIKREALAKDDARQRTEAVAGQIQAEQARVTADIQSELDARQVDLSKALEEGKITYRQYHKAIEADEREALRKRLKAQIEYYKKVMEAEGVSKEEQRKALSELASLYDQLGRVTNESVEENPNAWWDNMDWQGKFQAIADAAKQAWDIVNQVVSASIQNQMTDLDNEQKRIDKDYERRLEQVRNMGLSERQQELETARIEREHEAETERLEEEKAALQTKQARWNKANSLVQAAINGALAITQAFAQAGPIAGAVFAGIVAATTAAQIAVIAAQKIPEYRTGRRGGPAELAVVGDGGVSEVIESPSGAAVLTPSTPTLARLGAGDRVYKDVEEYLSERGGDKAVVGELRAMRRQNTTDLQTINDTMTQLQTRLAVTSAGLAWLRGGRGAGNGRG